MHKASSRVVYFVSPSTQTAAAECSVLLFKKRSRFASAWQWQCYYLASMHHKKGMLPYPLEVYCRLDLDPNFGEEWLIILFT